MTTKKSTDRRTEGKDNTNINMEVLSLYKLGSTECYEHLPVDVVLYKTILNS